MKVTFWGARGSVASPGPDTVRFGGNTSCVELRGSEGTLVVLDAGTGIRRLGVELARQQIRRVDLLLTHLHMDHLQGLGFFAPLYDPRLDVHIWGPASPTMDLGQRLRRYLSPPLFPVLLRDLPCKLTLHEVPSGEFDVGEFHVSSSLVCHPGATMGYRLCDRRGAIAYIPDHEPALGVRSFPMDRAWTSGAAIAEGVDLLIHDAQYTDEEYRTRVGWGHSTIDHTLAFARLVGAKHLVAFHHDPARQDDDLARVLDEAIERVKPGFPVTAAAEGASIEV
jgi:phosphoribosyl 1,2-cyclic phosphodiesterase